MSLSRVQPLALTAVHVAGPPLTTLGRDATATVFPCRAALPTPSPGTAYAATPRSAAGVRVIRAGPPLLLLSLAEPHLHTVPQAMLQAPRVRASMLMLALLSSATAGHPSASPASSWLSPLLCL
jgi:hypothetical protein